MIRSAVLVTAILSVAGCVSQERVAREQEAAGMFRQMSYGEAMFYLVTAASLGNSCASVDPQPFAGDLFAATRARGHGEIDGVPEARAARIRAGERRGFIEADRAFRSRHGMLEDGRGNACDIARAEIRAGTPIGMLLR